MMINLGSLINDVPLTIVDADLVEYITVQEVLIPGTSVTQIQLKLSSSDEILVIGESRYSSEKQTQEALSKAAFAIQAAKSSSTVTVDG